MSPVTSKLPPLTAKSPLLIVIPLEFANNFLDPPTTNPRASAPAKYNPELVSDDAAILGAEVDPSGIFITPLNVPVVPDIAPLLTKDPVVVTPVANISPSLLKVIPLPTTIPFRAVISPTASTFVTSS